MFNLIVIGGMESWDQKSFELSRSRIGEYTTSEIKEKILPITEVSIDKLKSIPTLFVSEMERCPSVVGRVTGLRFRQNEVVIEYEIDRAFSSIHTGDVQKIETALDMDGFELSRTHWAVKDDDLLTILKTQGYITDIQISGSFWGQQSPPFLSGRQSVQSSRGDVFIVHGHDEVAKNEMSDFVKSLGLEPVILHRRANLSSTIIEKIEKYSNVRFAIVLYTPCDWGGQSGRAAFERPCAAKCCF